jgi:hypothetical protein
MELLIELIYVLYELMFVTRTKKQSNTTNTKITNKQM